MKLKGKKVFVKTITNYYTGLVRRVTKSWIALTGAAWIADTGRLCDAMSRGTLSEVEPIPGEVMIARQNIVEVAEWNHDLPDEQK